MQIPRATVKKLASLLAEPLIEALVPRLQKIFKKGTAPALTEEGIAAAVNEVLGPTLEVQATKADLDLLATKGDLDDLATKADLDQRATELKEAVTNMESRLTRWIVGSAAVLAGLVIAATAMVLTLL